MASKKIKLHLLPNAHLDPVWLWDWREGLTEGITTVSTVLGMMDEYPELTFNRGEASIYRHIQQYAPEVFERIMSHVASGRWDVVGGTIVQPDSNLSSTETLCRQFEAGLAYFDREMGVRPKIAWQADSFGHPAGWPNILRSFGMEGFMFTRPQREQFAMESPLFWWDCDYEDRLLCYRQHFKWYCSERGNMDKILDQTLESAIEHPYQNVGVLVGLGNHGGGPSRRNIEEAAAWAIAHPEVEVCYSTMHRFFEQIQSEIKGKHARAVPSVSGEFGYCLRGCYSSVQKLKSVFREAERLVPIAEASQAIIGSQIKPLVQIPLEEAWDGILFNSFHDILPGSSIERAVDDQIWWTGGLVKTAQEALYASMHTLSRAVDTRVPEPEDADKPKNVPILIWNPAPTPYQGSIELEASLDYRPIWEYRGRPDDLPLQLCDEKGKLMSFQRIATEHCNMPDVPWRGRVVTSVSIPAFGWKVVRMGVAKEPVTPKPSVNACRALQSKLPTIANDTWSIGLTKADGVAIKQNGKKFFTALSGLKLRLVEDPWGSWGGMVEEPESYCLDKLIEDWQITNSEITELGPERSVLWTRWSGANSWCELSFHINSSTPWVEVRGRLLLNERAARLQLVLPSQGTAICDVPGSVVNRTERGQVPVARWFTRENSEGKPIGLYTENLSDADFLAKETRLTLARASRYACDVPMAAGEKPWMPATDCGELKFKLALFGGDVQPAEVTRCFQQAPVSLPVTPGEGRLPPKGSFGTLKPDSLGLLSAQSIEGGVRLRLQNRGVRRTKASFQLGGVRYEIGSIAPLEIATRDIHIK